MIRSVTQNPNRDPNREFCDPLHHYYLCHFANLIRYHNNTIPSVSAAFKCCCNVFVSVKFLLSSLSACFFVVFLTSNSFHCTDHLLYYTYTHNTLYHTSARHDHVHIHSALTQPLRPFSAHRHEGHTRIQARTRPLISYSFEHHTQRAALATHTSMGALRFSHGM